MKWYRGHDTGETFSLYTYIKEGSESTKYYCSLVSELREVEQVLATSREENRMILDFGIPNPIPRIGRPLTINEVIILFLNIIRIQLYVQLYIHIYN